MCGGSKTITTITVASVAFNLNGSPDTRRKYTPTQVFGAINRNSQSLSDDVTGALLKGPNVKFRSLLNHAKSSGYYDLVGQNRWGLGKSLTLSQQLELEKNIAGDGLTMVVLAFAGINQHSPAMACSEYFYGGGLNYPMDFYGYKWPYYDPTNKGVVSEYWYYYANDTLRPVYTGVASETWAWKIWLLYYKPSFNYLGSRIYEPQLSNLIEFPDEIQYMHLTSNTTTSHSVNLTRTTLVTKSYSNGNPTETLSNTVEALGTFPYENFTKDYSKVGYLFDYENSTDGKRYDYMHLIVNIIQSVSVVSDITTDILEHVDPNGVLITTTTTVTTERLSYARSSQRSKHKVSITSFGPVKPWWYTYQTGSSYYDNWIAQASSNEVPFFPVLPIRHENQMISVTRPDIAAVNKRLMRRGFGISYMKLEDSLAEHPDLADIDHAYLFFGVPINAKDNASKLYLFKFFEYFLKDSTTKTPHSIDGWQRHWDLRWFDNYKSSTEPYITEPIVANQSPNQVGRWLHISNSLGLSIRYGFRYEAMRHGNGAAFGWLQSGKVHIGLEPTGSFRKWNDATNDARLGTAYSALLDYADIHGNSYGLYSSDIQMVDYAYPNPMEMAAYGAMLPDLCNNYGSSHRVPALNTPRGIGLIGNNNYGIIDDTHDYVITYQVNSNKWYQIRLSGLVMENWIYGDKKTLKGWPDQSIGSDEDSDFIIPLHEGVLKSMNFMDATEVCTQAGFVLCNCYVVNITKVKKKGFLGFLIGILVAVVAITIAIVAPQLAPGMSALFTSLGSSLGFTGMAAVIAGGAVSMLAGLVLTQIITGIATLIFGDKLGALIGAIISVAVGHVAMGMQQGQAFISAAKGLVSAEGVLAMTSAVGNGLQEFYQISAQQKVAKLHDFIEESQRELKSIWDKNQRLIEKYEAEFGRTAIMFNRWSSPNESMDTFIARTLLLGSDVAAITNGYVTNFVASTITLKKALD